MATPPSVSPPGTPAAPPTESAAASATAAASPSVGPTSPAAQAAVTSGTPTTPNSPDLLAAAQAAALAAASDTSGVSMASDWDFGEVQTIDDKIIQRLLFVCSDLLGVHLQASVSYEKMCLLTTGDSTILNGDQQYKALKRQQELFSDSVIPSDQVAHDLFKDNYTADPIDLSYVVTNYLIIFLGGSPFFINIDTLNSTNGKIFISNLNIKNQSREAYTMRSNYAVKLKLNFTTFDDLLEKSVVAHSLTNSVYTQKISILQLLYKFLDFPGPQLAKSVPDSYGLFLVQNLRYDKNHPRFKSLFSALNVDTVTKTYHLTFHKHSFEMFKNEDVINKLFENELHIEYIAYEADGVDKPVDKETNKRLVPKVNSNIFKLLSDDNLKGAKISQRDWMGSGAKSFSDIVTQYKKIAQEVNDLNKLLSCAPNTEKGAGAKQNKERLKQLTQDLTYIRTTASRTLVFTILRLCQVYKIKVPYSLLGVYEKSLFMESLAESFSLSNIGMSAAETAAIGAGVAAVELGTAAFTAAGAATVLGAGLAAIGPLAIVGFVGFALIKAAMASKIVTEDVSVERIRSYVGSIIRGGLKPPGAANVFTVEKRDKFLELAVGALGKDQFFGVSRDDFQVLNGTSDTAKQNMDKILSQAAAINVPEEDQGAAQTDIYFTTFGQIIKLLNILDPSGELRIICGGYLIDVAAGTCVYNNFANLPITINSLSNFLKQTFIDSDKNLKYDSELFFRDCYETLVKSILRSSETVLPSLTNSSPRNIKVMSTLHVQSSKIDKSWLKKETNILADADFNSFKTKFLGSKNFGLADNGFGNGSIYKIFVIGSYDEIKYYDFYKDYRKYAVTGAANKRNLFSDKFQEFINKKHLMPCLLMKGIADSESILKKKYVNFSRIDNQNLNTGNFLNGSGQLRFPYQFTADFKIFTAFFMDIGAHIFIAPPLSGLETITNMFGFGGLYVIKGAQMDYEFQRIENQNLTAPNIASKYTLEGYMISHGDSIIDNSKIDGSADQSTVNCGRPINGEPASK